MKKERPLSGDLSSQQTIFQMNHLLLSGFTRSPQENGNRMIFLLCPKSGMSQLIASASAAEVMLRLVFGICALCYAPAATAVRTAALFLFLSLVYFTRKKTSTALRDALIHQTRWRISPKRNESIHQSNHPLDCEAGGCSSRGRARRSCHHIDATTCCHFNSNETALVCWI
jgi:hypothetical protein